LPKTFFAVVVTLAVSFPGQAGAQNSASTLSFAGFGTLGVVHSSESDADFTSSAFEARGAGYSRRLSPEVDSVIAAQVTAQVGSRFTVVVQLLSQENYDNNYRPEVEWANVQYQVTPDFSVRVGRTAAASFLVSDTRRIGYANPWVRPPVELYSLVSVTSNDGADLSYRVRMGAATDTLHLSVGRINYRFPLLGGSDVERANARQQFAVDDTFEHGSTTLHVSYGQAHVTIPLFAPLFAGFRQFGAQGEGIADLYDVDNRIISFLGAGASYNPGPWFLTAEWGRVDAHSVIGEKTAWYASCGYRLAQWTPYLTFANLRANSVTSDPGLSLTGLTPSLAAAAAGLNAGLNATLASIARQSTVSVGTRWDFARSADLKLQYDHTRLGAGSPGVLIDLQPGFRTGTSVNLVSLAVDFVW
jgi:hypothetical protein